MLDFVARAGPRRPAQPGAQPTPWTAPGVPADREREMDQLPRVLISQENLDSCVTLLTLEMLAINSIFIRHVSESTCSNTRTHVFIAV